ncbi:MAG: hypothetical protein QOE90_2168 [Thermoplasmata archaeon]|jgi:DNA-binding transcriptional ArsR family regulator|nr:hypothetical protein [Thermoplasmata archaeon]
MTRRPILLILLLVAPLLACPPAADAKRIPYAGPCIQVHVELPDAPPVDQPCPPGADTNTTFNVTLTAHSAVGLLTLVKAYVMWTPPEAAAPQRNAPSGFNPVQQAPDPNDGAYLRVHVRVAWGGSCDDLQGEMSAEAQGMSVSPRPSSALAAFCGAVPDAALAMDAVQAIAQELSEASAPMGETLRDALAPAPQSAEPAPGTDVGAEEAPANDTTAPAQAFDTSADAEAAASPQAASAETREEVALAALGQGVTARAEAAPLPPPPGPSAPPPLLRLAAPALPAPAAPAFVPPPPPAPVAVPAPAPRALAPPPAVAPAASAPPRAALAQPDASPPTGAVEVVAGAALLLLAAVALYQRRSRPDALQHPVRARLYEACAALDRPARAGELQAAAGVPRKAVAYHLRYLVRLGLLREDAPPDAPRTYALPAVRPPAPEAPVETRILALVRDRPGLCVTEIARETGVGYGRVDRRLRLLAHEGAVECHVDAGERRYFAA